MMAVVRAFFQPEFLNRVDEIILFHRLRREDMGSIVDIQFRRLQRLSTTARTPLRSTPRAASGSPTKATTLPTGRGRSNASSRNGCGPLAGFSGEIADGSTVRIGAAQGRLTVNGKPVGGERTTRRVPADDRAVPPSRRSNDAAPLRRRGERSRDEVQYGCCRPDESPLHDRRCRRPVVGGWRRWEVSCGSSSLSFVRRAVAQSFGLDPMSLFEQALAHAGTSWIWADRHASGR